MGEVPGVEHDYEVARWRMGWVEHTQRGQKMFKCLVQFFRHYLYCQSLY